MEDYQKIYSFLPYFKELSDVQESSNKETKSFYIRQDMMHTDYSEEMLQFNKSVYASNFIDKNYSRTLEEYGIKNEQEMEKCIVTADRKLLKAILTHMLRAERFVSGAWISYEHDGLFLKVLQRFGTLYSYSS